MTLFLKKIWESIKKYWQIFVGLFVGLGFAIRLWWQLRAQKKVMKNEIESTEKIREAEEKFSEDVRKATELAHQKHEERKNDILASEDSGVKEAKEEFDKRVGENRDGTNEELANKIGSSLGVNVVLPEDDDA
jgi:hypothetical protein